MSNRRDGPSTESSQHFGGKSHSTSNYGRGAAGQRGTGNSWASNRPSGIPGVLVTYTNAHAPNDNCFYVHMCYIHHDAMRTCSKSCNSSVLPAESCLHVHCLLRYGCPKGVLVAGATVSTMGDATPPAGRGTLQIHLLQSK